MDDRSVKPVGNVRAPSENEFSLRVNASDRAEHVANTHRSAKRSDDEKERLMNVSNLAIHFNVDEETNRLIVVVSDRESGRVIRTIPASEFEKMRAGDLLKLKA